MKLLPDQDEQDLAAMLRGLFAADATSPTLIKSLADAGVLALTVPDEYGGSGGELSDLGVFGIEAGRALCPTIVHSTMQAGLAIDALGGPEQRAAWLPQLSAGNLTATTRLWSSRDAGVLTPMVRAHPDGAGGWGLRGSVDFVADADLADHLVVSATDASTGRTLAFVVNLRSPGLRVDPLSMMGAHRAACLHFDDVAVHDDAAVLAGPDGRGVSCGQLRRLANTTTTLLSLDLVGVGDAVLQRTVDYTLMRHQFGRPIASFQAAQHLVANMHIALSAARLSARSALFWIGRGRTATRETAIARMHAATAAKLITLDAHQLHGGMGYVVETDLHLFSERARVLATLGGGADVAAAWLETEQEKGP